MNHGASRELINRLRRHDQSALSVVLTDVLPQLWSLLAPRFRGALSNEDIEDIFGLCLFKLWQSRERFDEKKGEFDAWLYVILRNTTLDTLRKKSAGSQEWLEVERSSAASGAAAAPTGKEWQDILNSLSGRERLVLLPLFDGSGVSIAQLSEQLELSCGGVRQLRFRALRKLEKLLKAAGFIISRRRKQATDSMQ
jgi:RNA polymerase sigma factor (sigma-70 family)